MRPVAAGPTLHLGGRGPGVVSALPAGTVRMTRDGRSALAWVLERVAHRHSRRVAVPAYICRSVVAAVEAAGYVPEYYRVSDTLEPDLDHVAALLAAGADALVAVHYFGVPVPRFAELRALAQRHDATLIEDCAHALFSRDADGELLGSHGDAAIFSFRKALPLPEGGAAVVRIPVPEARPAFAGSEVKGLLRELAFRADAALAGSIGWSPRAQLAARRSAIQRYRNASDERAVRIDEPIGAISARFAAHVDPAEVVERRRANFERLATALPSSAALRPLVPELPPGACPVGFPVFVADPGAVVNELLARRVQPRVFWDDVPEGAAEVLDDRLRAGVIVLPVHQDLPLVALDQVADATMRALPRSLGRS